MWFYEIDSLPIPMRKVAENSFCRLNRNRKKVNLKHVILCTFLSVFDIGLLHIETCSHAVNRLLWNIYWHRNWCLLNPIYWAPGPISQRINRPEPKDDQLPPSGSRVKECVKIHIDVTPSEKKEINYLHVDYNIVIVSTVTGHGLGDREIAVWFRQGQKKSAFLQRVDKGDGALLSYHSMRKKDYSPRIKRTEFEENHWLPSSSEVKNTWSCISNTPRDLMVQSFTKYGQKREQKWRTR